MWQTLGKLNFVNTKNLVPTGGHYALHSFYQNLDNVYVSYYQEGTHYCTAHKYSTETVINVSRIDSSGSAT